MKKTLQCLLAGAMVVGLTATAAGPQLLTVKKQKGTTAAERPTEAEMLAPTFQAPSFQGKADVMSEPNTMVTPMQSSITEESNIMPVKHNRMAVTPYNLPFNKTFPTESSMDEMTIIDANADGNTWTWDQYQKYARLSAPSVGSNDWLITPGLNLKAGKVYEFSSKISAGNPNAFPPMLQICIGKDTTVNAMTQEIVPVTTLTAYDTYFVEEFSVPTDGVYYVGIRGCSEKNLALIKVYNINVIGGAEAEGPGKCEDVVIEPDWSGRTKNVTVSFKAPTKTGTGNTLSSITKIEVQRDGVVINTFDNPTPGQSYSWVNTNVANGTYNYRLVGYNSVGQGGNVDTKVVVGAAGKTIPYLEDFRSADRFANELTFIDANNDGTTFWHATAQDPPYTWIHYDGKATSYNDDYLITPGIQLTLGSKYRVSVLGWGHNEGIELLMGSAPKIDSLTTKVVPTTPMVEDRVTYAGEFTPTYTGKYYLSLHATAEAGKRYEDFHATNILVEKIGTNNCPDIVTNFEAIEDPDGGKKITMKFNAPTKNFDGSTLSALTKIVIKRGTTTVKTIDAPALGAALEYTDEPSAEGEYTYYITPFSEAGEGAPLKYVGYAGVDLCAMPQNVKSTYLGNGKVKVTWDPVTTTAHGAKLAKAPIYVILEMDALENTQLGQTTNCEYTYDALGDKQQRGLKFGIYPFNSALEQGEPGVSPVLFAGEPYSLTYLESFENGSLSSPLVLEDIVFQPGWLLATDETFSDTQCADGDNGFFCQKGYVTNSGRAYTGKISLKNTITPTFSFYIRNINAENYKNEIAVEVKEVGADTWTRVLDKPIYQLVPNTGWGRVSVDLAAWKGKDIHVSLIPKSCYTDETHASYYSWTIMDGLRVHNLTNKDLGANIAVSSSTIDAGEDVDVTVYVANNGEQTATSYKVDLYKNGKLVDSLNGANLASGKTEKMIFPQSLDVADEDNVTYYAVVTLEGDENMADNTSKTATVVVNKPIYPMVSGLQGTETKGGTVSLTWNAPSMSNVPPTPYTETFESATAPSFSGACGWTFVDVDNAAVGGFQQFNFPQLTSDGNSKASFFVVDKTSSELGSYGSLFAGFGGSTKSIGSLLGWSDNPDDWAISPELYGGAQTVSFYAKNLQENMPEKVELWYSTGSMDPADFVYVKTWSITGSAYEKCSAYIPVGAKRVAIRHNFRGGILQVDDISFRRAGDTAETITLKGYNVFRNGEKLNDALITDARYTDTGVDAGVHSYAVNAVYDKGESNVQRVSITAAFVSGINDVNATVIGGVGVINVLDAAGNQVTVTGLDGNIYYSAMAQGNLSIRAAKGVYVVKVGAKAFKVVVK